VVQNYLEEMKRRESIVATTNLLRNTLDSLKRGIIEVIKLVFTYE
jgi:hypothetical protein